MNEPLVEKAARELAEFIKSGVETRDWSPELVEWVQQQSTGYVRDILALHEKIQTVLALPEPDRAKAVILLRKEIGKNWDLLQLKADSPGDPRYNPGWPMLVCSEEELCIKKFIQGRM